MMNLFDTTGAETLALVIGVFVVAAWLSGYASGLRHARVRLDDAVVQGKVMEACLAILGLLLAFTFASAYTKFETRRLTIVHEAVSISTFWTRTDLLPEPTRSTTKQNLKDYVQLHLDVTKTGLDIAATKALDQQLLALQNKILADVTKVLQQPENQLLAIPLMPSLNDMLDQYEIRVAARLDHVPASVVLLLLGVSVICSFMIGRSQGVVLKRLPWVTAMFLVLVVFIIYITFDLDQPWYGLSHTSQVPMIRLARSMGIPTP
jgi:hypothetical protein